MKPKFFASQEDFRKWLEKNHLDKSELIVGYYKVGTGKRSMTWSESVDQALCFGWIDGVRRSLDESSYQIRFTPRKASSVWSAVNIQKIKTLSKEGLMTPAGLAAFEKRKASRSAIYTHENEEASLSPAFLKQFRSNKTAWDFFRSLAPSYQKLSKNWVMSAKQEATRLKRLNQLIKDSEAGVNQWKHNKYNKPKAAKTKQKP